MRLKTKNNFYILFSIVGTIIVLWQLLASGYVLTLDMIFGPHVNLAENVGNLLNIFPLWYLLHLLTLVIGGWLTQKILLISIFFLLFFLPLHFFKKIFNLSETHGEEYVVSLFFAINPFVYERFLAGQWMIILGYILLVPFTAYLVEFCRKVETKNSLKLLAIIIAIGITSLHILVISLIIAALVFLICFIGKKFSLFFLKKCLMLGLAVLICSSYWLVPVIIHQSSPLHFFGPDHWEAFRTAGEGNFGVLDNILTLHGFWEEHEPWIKRFVLPNEMGFFFGVSLVSLLSVILVGLYTGFKNRQSRTLVIIMISILCLAVIFSCGVGGGIFRKFNLWLFEHIYFWRGFRDTQKWSSVIALLYALFAGLGVRQIILWLKKPEYKKAALYVILAIPLVYTPMMLFGFASQLGVVQYPESWSRVNDILKSDKNCRALFLPWKQYYYLRFNNSLLTINPSGNYFDCDIIHGKNMELGKIRSLGGEGEEYTAIEKAMINNYADVDIVIMLLKQKGIKYVIFTTDIVSTSHYKYPFLNSEYLLTVFEENDIYLYQVL